MNASTSPSASIKTGHVIFSWHFSKLWWLYVNRESDYSHYSDAVKSVWNFGHITIYKYVF